MGLQRKFEEKSGLALTVGQCEILVFLELLIPRHACGDGRKNLNELYALGKLMPPSLPTYLRAHPLQMKVTVCEVTQLSFGLGVLGGSVMGESSNLSLIHI